MENNRIISNPILVGAMELLKTDDTEEHRDLVMKEIMSATFLAPVVIVPAPVADENGNLHMQPDSRINFCMLKTPDEKALFMAFTDCDELRKWKNEKDQQTLALKLEDYSRMLHQKNAQGDETPAIGFAINPYGANIVVTREGVAHILAAKESAKKMGS